MNQYNSENIVVSVNDVTVRFVHYGIRTHR